MMEKPKMDRTGNPVQFRVLTGLVTTGYLTKLFRKSKLTIHLWRKHKLLPFVIDPGDGRASIRFDLKEVRRWAATNGIRMYLIDEVEVVG